MVKKRACVFISGSGTNLRSIIKNSREYNFPINIKLVISNQKHADGINFAKKFSIPHVILNYKRTKFEKIATKLLLEKKINLLCLAGFMKILSKKFIRNFKGNIINIHPSLLPKYKGLNTFNRVLRDGEKNTVSGLARKINFALYSVSLTKKLYLLTFQGALLGKYFEVF